MDSDRVSVTIRDDEIWEQRRARLEALESVNQSHCQAESKSRINTLPHTATKDGDVDKFIEALEMYSAEERASLSDIIHIRGPSGNSLLHVAAGIENPDILEALLEVIHDKRLVAKANNQGDTALHVAARAGRIRSAELLLGCGSIVHIVNDAGNTALHEAVKNGYSELTRLLLSQGSRAVYPKNKESKCPLYLAVETGNLEILKLLMQAMNENKIPCSRMQGMSPVHGAVMHQNLEMLKEMSKQKKELFYLIDDGGGTPLHLAAFLNYVEGVKFLVDEFPLSAFEDDKEGYLPIHIACKMFEDDKEGYLPIHIACKMGHIEIIKMLLQLWPNPDELLNLKDGQNILHVAAKYGNYCVVDYIVGNPKLEKLVNAKDKEGNTPLHVAAFHLQSYALFSLVSEDKVDLELVNNNNLTALDIADEQLKKSHETFLTYQLKAVIVLEAVKAPRSKDKAVCGLKDLDLGRDDERPYIKKLKEVANHRMLVATLVATMTFAAGFSVPGGYNGSKPDVGIATLLNKPMYNVFVICNTVAMYSSIMAAVILLSGQIAVDSRRVLNAIKDARLPLLISLATMSIGFMAGVYVTTSKRPWVADVALIMGIAGVFHTVKVHRNFFCWSLFHFRLHVAPLKRRWLSRRRRLSPNIRS